MRPPYPSLLGIAPAAPGSVISFIGGGGKTTLMLSLASAAGSLGMHVLVTTTTRIHVPPGMPLVLESEVPDVEPVLADCWSSSPLVALGRETTDKGKLVGVDSELLCELHSRFPEVLLLCEADGSAGRPLKVHAAHEPVVPSCSSTVFVVGGLDALGEPLSDDMVHRVELLKNLSSAASGVEASISATLFAQILEAAAGKASPTCTIVFALTKPDLARRDQVAEAIDAVRAIAAGRTVALVESGQVVELTEPLNA